MQPGSIFSPVSSSSLSSATTTPWQQGFIRYGFREAQAFVQGLEQVAWATNESQTIESRVKAIVQRVSQEGDAALYHLAAQFGDALEAGQSLAIPAEAWEAACQQVPEATKALLDEAAANMTYFAEAIMQQAVKPAYWQHPKTGYTAALQWMPVSSVGCYVPAGGYPLASSVLMTAIPARVAGVANRVMACPNPTPEMLYAAKQAGVHTFYRMGGAQAVAAFALGTSSIEPVAMVVGPGNAYVTEAKRQLLGVIGIDSLAGPSEVTLLADASAKPDWLAADMLAQAEHSPDARSVLITTDKTLGEQVQQAIETTLSHLKLPAFVEASSLKNSAVLMVETWEQACELCNRIAPEHLQLHLKDPALVLKRLTHYGTLFNGELATVPFGDYCAGPNHTLPTNRTARFSGALSPLTFLKPQQTLSVSTPEQAEYLARFTEPFARLEGLTAHAYAASLRGSGDEADKVP